MWQEVGVVISEEVRKFKAWKAQGSLHMKNHHMKNHKV